MSGLVPGRMLVQGTSWEKGSCGRTECKVTQDLKARRPVGKQDRVGLGLGAIGGREELSRRQAIVKECVEVGELALSLRE